MTPADTVRPALSLPGGVTVDTALDTVLVTGGTGFIGKVLVARLLHDAEALGLRRLLVLIRPRHGRRAQERLREDLLASPCLADIPASLLARIEAVEGDPTLPGLGMDPALRARLTSEVTHVLHVAASVRFDLPLAEAALQNTSTTLAMQDWARDMPRLVRFVLVSTAYVTPWREGVLAEDPVSLVDDPEALLEKMLAGHVREHDLLVRTGHPNTYTLTKALAEQLAIQRRDTMSLVIVRPSIVSACHRFPRPGWIDSVAAFGAFAALLLSGRMKVVLGGRETVLDLVPCDEVVARIVAAAAVPCPEGEVIIRHAVAGADPARTVLSLAHEVQRAARPRPLGCRPEVRFVGPHGWRGRLAEWRHHGLPLGAKSALLAWSGNHKAAAALRHVRAQVLAVNATFRHFTGHTYRFVATWPLEPAALQESWVEDTVVGLRRHLTGEWPGHALIAGAEERHWSSDLSWARGLTQGHEILRTAAWVMRKVLRRAFTAVSVDAGSFQRHLGALPPGMPLAILPTHRSFLDFVLVSYLAVTRPDLGLPIPHVAAAEEFGRIPLLGWFFRKAHAFFIRRGQGRIDDRLNATVRQLLEEGKAIEFYPEGQRSRTRQFLPPRTGMIRSLQATGRRVALLPVAISFEWLAEEEALAAERAGHPRPPFSLRILARWLLKLLQGRVRLGRVHIACAEPVRVEPDDDPHLAAGLVIRRLRQATVITRWHLEVELARRPVAGVTPLAVEAWLRGRGAVVLPGGVSLDEAVRPAVADSLLHQWLHHFIGDARRLYPEDAFLAWLEALWTLPGASVEPTDGEIPSAFVASLFGPLLDDARRALRLLQAFPCPRVHHAVSLLAELPGASFANVELAMAFHGARPGPLPRVVG